MAGKVAVVEPRYIGSTWYAEGSEWDLVPDFEQSPGKIGVKRVAKYSQHFEALDEDAARLIGEAQADFEQERAALSLPPPMPVDMERFIEGIVGRAVAKAIADAGGRAKHASA